MDNTPGTQRINYKSEEVVRTHDGINPSTSQSDKEANDEFMKQAKTQD